MFNSSDESLIEAVYKKHGFDAAIDILLYSTPDSETNTVSVDAYIMCLYCVMMPYIYKVYFRCHRNMND